MVVHTPEELELLWLVEEVLGFARHRLRSILRGQ